MELKYIHDMVFENKAWALYLTLPKNKTKTDQTQTSALGQKNIGQSKQAKLDKPNNIEGHKK